MNLPPSSSVLSTPAFVVSLSRHADERFYPTAERLRKAGFENVYPFQGFDGVYAGDGDDPWEEGLRAIGEQLLDAPVKNGYYTGGGQFGVFLSMLTLWRYLAMSTLDGMFIFEDDALPRPDFNKIFPTYWDAVDQDVDIIFLGGGSYNEEVRTIDISRFDSNIISPDGLIWKGQVDCLHAYYLTKKGARKLLDMYEKVTQYDPDDPLLEDHFKNNMEWFSMSAWHLTNFTDSNQHSDVVKNLQVWRKEVREDLGLACDKEGVVIECESNRKKIAKCFDPSSPVFNQNFHPRLQKEHYIADGFMCHLLTPNRFHWDSLKPFMRELCKNFKSAAFVGDTIPLTSNYEKDEIPWGSLPGQSPRNCGIIHQNCYQQSSIHTLELSKPENFDAREASHIFLIGPDRCGGETLLQFLGTRVPIKGDRRGRIASKMVLNFFSSLNILDGLEEDPAIPAVYGNMQALFDAGDVRLEGTEQRAIPLSPYRLFKELYYQYPDSKFIFNTRPVNQWISGRRKIADGYIMDYYQRSLNPHLVGTPEWKEKSQNEVILHWKRSFEKHTEDVWSFFEDKEPWRFLHFDISSDQPERLINFLPELDLDINDAWEIRSSWGSDILKGD